MGNGEDGAVVLPVSIDLSGVGEQFDELGARLAASISAALGNVGRDVPRGAGGRGVPAPDVASTSTGTTGTKKGGKAAKTDLAFDSGDVSSALQAAIGSHKFKLNIDEQFLINQVQAALNTAFQIKVSGAGAQQAGGTVVTSNPIHDTTSAMSRETLDVPKELREALHQVKDKNKASVLAGAIDDLYGTLQESFSSIGKSVRPATDHISKAFAIFDAMGDDMFDAARAYDPQKAAATMHMMNQKFGVTGGPALNLATTLSAAIKAGGRTGFWGGAIDPADRHDWSIRQLRQAGMSQTTPVAEPTPVRMAPAAAPVTAPPSSAAIEQEQMALRIAMASSSNGVPVNSMKIGDTADFMRWVGIQNPGKASSRTRRGQAGVNRNAGGALSTAQGPGLPRGGFSGQDPEAEIAALEQLGEQGSGVRGLINWGALQGKAGGLPIDLRGLAISAMKPLGMEGSLRGLFKGRSSGSFYNVQPDIEHFEDSSAKIRDASRRRNARLPGIDEAVSGVSPTAAAEELARVQYGDEGAAFFNQPAVRAEFKKAVAHASRLSPIGVGQKGFSHIAGGGPASILGGIREYEASAAAGGPGDPETRAANIRESNLENQERVKAGAGLSLTEQMKKELHDKLPTFAKLRMQGGSLPDFPKIMENVLREVSAGGEPQRLSVSSQAALQERGGGAKAYASARLGEIQQLLIKGAAESVTDEDISRVLGFGKGGLKPEQAAAYRPGLGQDDARELRGFMSHVAGSIVGSIDPAGYARIQADKNNAQGLGTTKTTSFAEEDIRRRDSYTGRSPRAPKRQLTDLEKELRGLDIEHETFQGSTSLLKGVNKRREDEGLEQMPVPAFAPEKAARRSELQKFLAGVKRTRNFEPYIPTGATMDERIEQDRLADIAESKARRAGKDATGDDLVRAAAGAGRRIAGPLPADPKSPYFSAKVLDSLMRDADAGTTAAAGGAGGRPPRGRVAPPGGPGTPGGGGGRGFGEVSGAIHVIIDGQPVAVTMEGYGGAGSGAPAGSTLAAAMHGASFDFKQGRAALHRQTTDSAQKVFGQEVDRMRTAGISDSAIKRAAKNAGLGVAAEAFFNDDLAEGGFGSGGTGGGRSALNLRRRKLGLEPIKFRTEETLGAIDESDTTRSNLGAEVRKAQRFEPRRGFTASVTDIFTNMFPFIEKQSAAISRFAREGQQQASLEAKTPGLLENKAALESHVAQVAALRDEAQARMDTAKATHQSTREAKSDLSKYNKELNSSSLALGAATDAIEAHNVELGFQKERTNSAREGLPGAGGKIAAFGAGAVAAGGAIAVGMAISQLVNTTIEALSAAIAPAIDRAMGSPMMTSALVSAISKSGAPGTFEAATARAAAEAGLGQTDLSALTGQAQGVAGNRNLAAQADLIRAQGNLAQAGRGLPSGLPESIRTATGGIFGSGIGISGLGDFQLSTQEQAQKNLDRLPSFDQRQEALSPSAEGRRAQMESGGISKYGQGLTISGGFLGQALDQELAKDIAPIAADFKEGDAQLAEFNKQVEAGGSNLKLQYAASTEQIAESKKFSASLRAIGLDKFADKVDQAGLILGGGESTGANGALLLGAAQRGAAGFNTENLLAASEPQRRAREGLRRQQLDFALNTQIPAQFGQTYAANPLPTGGEITGLGKAAGIDLSGTAKGYDDIAMAAAGAIQQTKDFVKLELPDFGQKFSDDIDQISSIGRQISSIKIGQETKQAALAADQYSLSIYQAKRSLNDAKYLTGQLTAANKESVGYLQKQEFLLNRQSQQLSFQQTQRQINFQTALAGFQAPGITGQERAARMEEAKLEAGYAQKQLDIQKQIFSLSGDEFMAGAARQVNDLQRQIGLMIRGRALELSTVQANKDIDALNARLGIVKGAADAIYQAAVAKREAIYQDEAELVATTGKDLSKVANDVINAYVKVYRRLKAEIEGSLSGATSTQTETIGQRERRLGEDLNNNGRIGYASGIVGSTRGRTDITVGEADGEMVAVVKGPKTMSVMGAGNSGGINIGPFILQGGDVDREKAERLAREITDLVEARLGLKARLVGIRSTTA